MHKLMILAAGASVLAFAAPASASDHVLTGVRAGGLTTSSQPFQNGVNNPGRTATLVPGQGSPLSGEDHTTPAVESGSLLTHHFTQPNTQANPGNGTLRTPPPVVQGRTAPSAMSPH
jgi:hypothetical protein